MSEEMTREQAIQIVSEIRDIDGFPLDDKKALNMAIAALSAEPCEDAISKDSVIDILDYWYDKDSDGYVQACKSINDLPPVHAEPITGRCRDCKWWKDSDGVYRRGVAAESSCPFNTKEIYNGDAYCYRFEKHISGKKTDETNR